MSTGHRKRQPSEEEDTWSPLNVEDGGVGGNLPSSKEINSSVGTAILDNRARGAGTGADETDETDSIWADITPKIERNTKSDRRVSGKHKDRG